jgi:hypothetical protein
VLRDEGWALEALMGEYGTLGAYTWVGVLWASAQMPGWLDPHLWTALVALGVAGAVDALNLVLFYGIAREGLRRPEGALWLYASAFLPLAAAYRVSPAIETAFVLGALWLLVVGMRRVHGAVAAGAIARVSLLVGAAVAVAAAVLRPGDAWAVTALVPLVCLALPDWRGAAVVAGLGGLAAGQAWLFPGAAVGVWAAAVVRLAVGAGLVAMVVRRKGEGVRWKG